jgi:uncharacterized protein affecting Mg2+/Co2+ transport
MAIQLYRILQRQCLELSEELRKKQQTKILLQPPLDPHQAGSSRIISSKGASGNREEEDEALLFHLFYRWNHGQQEATDSEELLLHEWCSQLTRHSTHHRDDDETDTDDEDVDAYDLTLWTHIGTVQKAIRSAFQHDFDRAAPDLRHFQHQCAIRAYQFLAGQKDLLRRLSSSSSLEHSVQVTATSKYTGYSQRERVEYARQRICIETKYRFVYRIRIQNLSTTETIQLVGRTWNIQEYDSQREQPIGDLIIVHAPQTGAVGRLPVLRPGQAFEYVSGAELATSLGCIKGCFHFARVPPDTPSARMGMPPRRAHTSNHLDRVAVNVQPFWLRVEPGTTGIVQS